jgi:hypothetical protein
MILETRPDANPRFPGLLSWFAVIMERYVLPFPEEPWLTAWTIFRGFAPI